MTLLLWPPFLSGEMPIHLLTRKPCLCGQRPQSEITPSIFLTLYTVTQTIASEDSVKGNKVAIIRWPLLELLIIIN